MQLKKSHIIVILSTIIFLLISGFFINILYSKIYGKERAKAALKDFYKLSIGLDIEVLSIEEKSGVYRATIRSGSEVQDVFITKDLKGISDDVADINTEKERISKEKVFSSCLRNKGVWLFTGNDPDSQQQLSNLGRFSNLLTISCIKNRQLCEKVGIKITPSVLFKDVIYPGLKNPKWFENVMGCKLN